MHMRQKFEDEVTRVSKFQRNFFAEQQRTVKPKQIDLKDYAKYVLREGAMIEKREFLTCLRSRLILAKKVIATEKEAYCGTA